MELESSTRERIETLIGSDRVVLFMKGTRESPQCGFSATVARILDQIVPEYTTVDVLSEPGVREGIKVYSDWPTIPQLYVSGEFVGGCDIVKELYGERELHRMLGADAQAPTAPTISISDEAAEALRPMAEAQEPGRDLHLSIDARFQNALYFGPGEPDDLRVETNGVTICMDPLTARRAEGLSIGVVETPEGPGFQIENPNAPQVEPLTAPELKAMLDRGEAFELLDVRTPEERAQADIPGARLLDEETRKRVESLGRDATLVFHCHHGGRSQKAAEHFAALGFRKVYNVVGGIDAWSREVDPSVPRY